MKRAGLIILLFLFSKAICAQELNDRIIFQKSIEEVCLLYKEDSNLVFANELRNDILFITESDSARLGKEIYARLVQAMQYDHTVVKLDLKQYKSDIATVSSKDLNKYFHKELSKPLPDFKKLYSKFRALVRFSQLFYTTSDECIIYIDYWCSMDCGSCYVLFFKKVNGAWEKTKLIKLYDS